MNKARKLTAILFSALLISACTDTHVASTAPSSSTTPTTQALDSTSMAQISQMLEELEPVRMIRSVFRLYIINQIPTNVHSGIFISALPI